MIARNQLVRRFGPGLILLGHAAVAVHAGQLFITADGLKADSPRIFTVYSNTHFLAQGKIGTPLDLAPGTYTVHVGFPSGWLSQDVTIAGPSYTLPTGLFEFEALDRPEVRGTVPQCLYYGNSYLATGYGGQRARLLPGTYTVRYHSHDQDPLSTAVTSWWYAGPIPAAAAGGDIMQQEYPPETNLNLRGSFSVDGKAYPWSRLETSLAMNLRPVMNNKTGVVYLTTKISSVREQEVGLVLALRGGCRVWLNGEPLTGAPHRGYDPPLRVLRAPSVGHQYRAGQALCYRFR